MPAHCRTDARPLLRGHQRISEEYHRRASAIEGKFSVSRTVCGYIFVSFCICTYTLCIQACTHAHSHMYSTQTASTSNLHDFQAICHLHCQCIHHRLFFFSTHSRTAKSKPHVKIADDVEYKEEGRRQLKIVMS